MLTLRRCLIVGLCLDVILTACSPTAVTSIPPTAQPTSQPTASVPTREPIGLGVPAIEHKSGQDVLLVVSSMTGKELDAYAPIPLGQSPIYVLSPDERTLAVISSVSYLYPTNVQLYLIDLPSWKFRTVKLDKLHEWFSAMAFSPDGTSLIISAGPSGELLVIDSASGEVKASMQAGFAVRNIKFTSDGKAIMAYGPLLAHDVAVSIGAPKATLYSASDLRVLWSADLADLRDGIFPKKKGLSTDDLFKPGAAWNFTPGVVFAPHQDVLYAMHGDEDKLTTVDFSNRKVSTVDVRVKTSWLDQLMALTAGVAHAKGMDGTSKQAVISPDGKFLYVVGTTETVTPQQNGNWDFTQTALGLQVVAVEDGGLLNKIETDATSIDIAPDGQHLFLRGWKNDIYGTAWTEIFDTSSKRLVKHLDDVSLIQTRRMDRQAILMSCSPMGENIYTMAAVEPETWAIVSKWKGTDYVGWLIDP